MVTVGEIKQILQDSLDQLEDYDDSDEVKSVSNTYFLRGCEHFLGISSEGYINLSDIEVKDKDEEDEEED